jgi:magnesium transporter
MQYSSLGQRTNEVMRVLTVISSIFIPLTFVVGVYGMNFDTASPYNMPELRWRFGYPMVMAAMTTLAVAMVWTFYRAGWIGRK